MTKSKKTTLLRLLETKKQIERCISEFPNEQIKPEWLPIDTAPKDGTHILVCSAPGENEMSEGLSIFCHNVAWWGGADDGRWVVYCSMVQDPGCFFEPTHWMPLPPPPVS